MSASQATGDRTAVDVDRGTVPAPEPPPPPAPVDPHAIAPASRVPLAATAAAQPAAEKVAPAAASEVPASVAADPLPGRDHVANVPRPVGAAQPAGTFRPDEAAEVPDLPFDMASPGFAAASGRPPHAIDAGPALAASVMARFTAPRGSASPARTSASPRAETASAGRAGSAHAAPAHAVPFEALATGQPAATRPAAEPLANREAFAPVDGGPATGGRTEPIPGASPTTDAAGPGSAPVPATPGFEFAVPVEASPVAAHAAVASHAPSVPGLASGQPLTAVTGNAAPAHGASAPIASPHLDRAVETVVQRLAGGPVNGSVVVPLDPPDLGRVMARFTRRGEQLKIQLVADSPAVAAALEKELPRLQAALSHGGSHTQVEVQLGADAWRGAQQHAAPQNAAGDAEGRSGQRAFHAQAGRGAQLIDVPAAALAATGAPRAAQGRLDILT